MYYLLKAKYLLGENSNEEKKRERLNNALDEYFTFTDEFPQSKYRKEADKFFANTKKLMNLSDEAVSYTHLTLPTICSVQISVVAVSLKKKTKKIAKEEEAEQKQRETKHMYSKRKEAVGCGW
eukprot:TRINITY_DN1820_c0_g1_i2.p2 TRINITY_DN1820_c0_g1~~TRINITY_DN1820_c0_g1_i2.p2  ORF type:complete len:123 (-),score=28.90 TRINITY_DN1820_c0_g1_i2:16-384(-)